MTEIMKLIERANKATEWAGTVAADILKESVSAIEALQAENERLREMYSGLKRMVDDGSIHERTYSAGIELERRNAELQAKLDALEKQEPDLRGIDAGPLSEWRHLAKYGLVKESECLIRVRDIPRFNSQNAAPKAQEPLTSKQIRAIEVEVATSQLHNHPTDAEAFTRAIEAAHGIGSQQ